MIFPKFYGTAVSDVAKEDVVGSAYSCHIYGCETVTINVWTCMEV